MPQAAAKQASRQAGRQAQKVSVCVCVCTCVWSGVLRDAAGCCRAGRQASTRADRQRGKEARGRFAQ